MARLLKLVDGMARVNLLDSFDQQAAAILKYSSFVGCRLPLKEAREINQRISDLAIEIRQKNGSDSKFWFCSMCLEYGTLVFGTNGFDRSLSRIHIELSPNCPGPVVYGRKAKNLKNNHELSRRLSAEM